MDTSPGNAKPDPNGPSNLASTCSDSPPVQESPYSVFLNNLSPLELKKAANVPQGFVGINSPPLVFTSPRITLPCDDAHTFKRPQVLQLSTEESPQHDACAISHQDDSKKSDTVLVTDSEDIVVRDFVEAQPSNSSSGIEGFLVDPITVDCANSSFPTDPHGKEVCSSSPRNRTPMKITTTYLEQKNPDAAEHVGNKLERSEFQKSKIVWKKMEIKDNRHHSEQCANDCSNALSDASVDHILQIRQCQDFATQSAGGCDEDEFEYPTNSIPGSFSKANAYRACDGNSGASVSNLASRNHSEVMTKHRALLRRCLFDEVSPDNSTTRSSSSSASNVISSGLSATSSELERLNLTRARSTSVSRKTKVQEMSIHIGSNVPPRTSANFPLIASRPLGIGLHLNSVVSGKTIGPITTSSSQFTGCNLSTQEAKPASFDTWDVLNNNTSCSSIEKFKYSAAESRHDIDTSDIRTTATAESAHDIEPQTLPMPLERFAEGSPYDFDTSTRHASAKRNFSLDLAESPDEINQMSPKKRSKRESSISAGDGCKHCNCRKSKCLKLYCDCFAAGLYCSEPCACQGCFNRPEYQDKVNDTRKQIESRNPSAFAPKIVESLDQLPENNMERENLLPPSLARHKRGCNCKKSMCLKKYCECYQANVGCSDNCRCEGCRNVYGTKQGYGLSKQLLGNRVGDESDGEDNFKPLAANDGSPLIELLDPHSLTPITPSLQFSDHGKGAPRPRLPLATFISSPDSDVTALLSAESKPTEGADSSVMQISRSKATPGSGMRNRIVEPSSEIIDGFSPRRDSLLNLSHLTPRLGHPVGARSSSSSLSKAKDSIPARGSRIVLVSKSGEESSSSYSPHGRTTPITPITDLLLPSKSGKNLNSGSGISEVLEDDTPEILKEASTPPRPLNVSSPNRKRVSPPHGRAGSSSSVSLKSGRKFILKAVPSFPPLTPCIESRGSKNLDTTNLQDDSRDK